MEQTIAHARQTQVDNHSMRPANLPQPRDLNDHDLAAQATVSIGVIT
jgi:hypothetical protein